VDQKIGSSAGGRSLRIEDAVIDLDYARLAAFAGKAVDRTFLAPFSLVKCSADAPPQWRHTQEAASALTQQGPSGSLDPKVMEAVYRQAGKAPYWLGDGWSADGAYSRLYDAAAAKHFEGRIAAIKTDSPMKLMAPGVEWTVTAGEERRDVQLGPQWFVDAEAMPFRVGDPVQIDASPANVDGRRVWIASRVAGRGDSLVLRGPDGRPAWIEDRDFDGPPRFVKGKTLLGKDVIGSSRETLGRVVDVVFNMRNGRIAYLAVESPEGLHAVPLGAFEATNSDGPLQIRIAREIFAKSPVFSGNTTWPAKIDRTWVEYVSVRYGNPGVQEGSRDPSLRSPRKQEP
jgi:sporulation protein YlmC with PRC-barrel domain